MESTITSKTFGEIKIVFRLDTMKNSTYPIAHVETKEGKKYGGRVGYDTQHKKELFYFSEKMHGFDNFGADYPQFAKMAKQGAIGIPLKDGDMEKIKAAIESAYDWNRMRIGSYNGQVCGLWAWNNAFDAYQYVTTKGIIEKKVAEVLEMKDFGLIGFNLETLISRIFDNVKLLDSDFTVTGGSYNFDGYEMQGVDEITFSLESLVKITPLYFEKELKSKEHEENCLKTAKETGKSVLIRSYTTDSEQFGEDESSTCTVSIYAMPNGDVKQSVSHHY